MNIFRMQFSGCTSGGVLKFKRFKAVDDKFRSLEFYPKNKEPYNIL